MASYNAFNEISAELRDRLPELVKHEMDNYGLKQVEVSKECGVNQSQCNGYFVLVFLSDFLTAAVSLWLRHKLPNSSRV